MNIDVVLDGKLKDNFFKDGALEYKKRLAGFTDLKIIETFDMDGYVKNLKRQDYKISLEIEGKELTSIQFSEKIKEIEKDGFYNKIVFLIGGSEGLSNFVKNSADFKFSMSKLTFLHQEAVMILVEQIYRAFKIMNNEPYHK